MDLLSVIEELSLGFTYPENRFGMLLCDQNASTISLQADAALTNRLSEGGVRCGASFLERTAGTNAIDLSIRLRSSYQTLGAQHTCLWFDDMWLLAAPLILQKDELRGVFALVGTGTQIPALASVISATATKLLTIHMMNIDLSDRLSQLLGEQKAIVDNISNGLLVINRDESVRHMNSHAARILNLDPQTSIGRRFSDLIDFEPIIHPIFQSGIGYKDEELLIKTATRNLHLSDTVVPIKDEAGNVVSIVNTFREFGDVRKVAQRLGGSTAVYQFDDIIGESPKIKAAVRVAKKAAESDTNVLLVGESGVGKKLFAQAIHLRSRRKSGPFVAVNCAALSRDLIEEELFGLVGGKFDDVHKVGRPGKFELATEGTIFLDEISAMPLDLQIKVLEVLQEKQVTRVGGVQSFPADFRLIAASNVPLLPLVDGGAFRRDLFFRLSIIDIVLPPLRERREDIEKLAQHYFRKYVRAIEENGAPIPDDIMNDFKKYHWPGNIRELQNVVERLANGHVDFSLSEAPSPSFDAVHLEAFDIARSAFRVRPLHEHEKEVLSRTLKAMNFNISKAAKELGLSKPTLYKKIKEYGIEVNREFRAGIAKI
jgi:transcriptional regulator with PAS, ATPase and Fis domain